MRAALRLLDGFVAAAVCLSVGTLTAAWIAGGPWPVAAAPIAAGALVGLGYLRRGRGRRAGGERAGAMFLTAQTCLCGVGALRGLSPILLGLATLTALCVWDLARFRLLVALSTPGDRPGRTVRSHLARLGVVGAGAAALGGAGLELTASPSFGVLFLVVLVLTSSFRAVVRRSRRPAG